MTDYISREAALDALCKASTPCFSSTGKPILVFDVDYVPAINSIPAADVRPVMRGKWIMTTERFAPERICSSCKCRFPVSAGEGITEVLNFCPNCGADMMEES